MFALCQVMSGSSCSSLSPTWTRVPCLLFLLTVEDVCIELDQQLSLVDRMDYFLEDGYLVKFTDFHSIPVKAFAEQLTYLDSVSGIGKSLLCYITVIN